ncbi:MAG TPA: LysR family transcriptional regulator [Allosphingosinicella sp.]|uniref:LysR family transcriptional regulator n=1 Tax=Allosphingosinicella sp. TaxID=2823234 RepID=UPI002EDA933F
MTRHLEEMAVFAKVGDLGSMSGAARALGLPKSTVSRAVARLEAAYSARLVERTTRKVTLTEIGRALHAHCSKMVEEVYNAEAEIAAYQGTPSGRLRVAAPYSIGHVILKQNMPEFLDRYPNVDVQLQLTDRTLNPITDNFDVVIRIGWLEDSSLIARKITDVNAILVASRAYVEAYGLPSSPSDLGGHRIIGYPTSEPRPMDMSSGKERVPVPIWSRFACNDPLMNMELVQRGIAIAPVSAIIAAGLLEGGQLIHVLPKYKLLDQPAIYALYAGRTAISPKISVFLDFVSELARRVFANPALLRLVN